MNVGHVLRAILFSLCLLTASGADVLENLQVASCVWYADVYQEWQDCLESPDCLAMYDKGAYARDGGPTSKPAKMCAFRVQDIVDYCATGNPLNAWTNATKAVENWIGQVLEHWYNSGLPEQYLLFYFGLGIISADLHVCDGSPVKLACEKEYLFSLAEVYGEPALVGPAALSILAELYTQTCE